VTLAGGAATPGTRTSEDGEGGPDYNAVSYQFHESIIDDTSVQTVEVALDQYAWCTRGSTYLLTGGEILYAAELT
jgi:hypothetical protein